MATDLCCLFCIISSLSVGCERRSNRNGSVTVEGTFLCYLIISLNGGPAIDSLVVFGGLLVGFNFPLYVVYYFFD